MTKRLNIALPLETIEVIDRVASKGNRSRLISDAVIFYVQRTSRANLAQRMKAGAKANAQRDLEIASDWFSIDEETPHLAKAGKQR